MRAADLRKLAEQCAELAAQIPSNDAPFSEREAWWKEVRALRVGPLNTADQLNSERAATPAELSALRDALVHIDQGKDFKNSAPNTNPGRCVEGLTTASKILRAMAGRIRSGKSYREMFGDLLREAGILACVFGVLDGVWHEPAPPWGRIVAVFGTGLVMLAAGVAIERTR